MSLNLQHSPDMINRQCHPGSVVPWHHGAIVPVPLQTLSIVLAWCKWDAAESELTHSGL